MYFVVYDSSVELFGISKYIEGHRLGRSCIDKVDSFTEPGLASRRVQLGVVGSPLSCQLGLSRYLRAELPKRVVLSGGVMRTRLLTAGP